MYKLNIVHVFYSLSLHSYFCDKCSIPKIEHESQKTKVFVNHKTRFNAVDIYIYVRYLARPNKK